MTRGPGSSALHFLLRLLLVACAVTSPAFANIINVPADQKTIQAGIDAANPGDTVLVAPGTYYENIDFKGKAITVTSSGGAAATIIDGGATPSVAVVTFQTSETRSSTISNFTIRNGGPVTFGSGNGGGIYVVESSPTILNNVITANLCDGIDVSFGAPLIQGNNINGTLFAENAYCSFQTVGIVLEGNLPSSTLTGSVLGNVIEKNVSPYGYSNAAIFLWDSNGNIIMGNSIRDNVSSQGVVQMYNSESIIFTQNLVYDNSLPTNVSAGGASGLYLLVPDGSPPFYGIIANNTFVNNTPPSNVPGASQVYIDGDVSQYVFVNNILYGTGSSPLLVCNDGYVYLSPGPMLVENNDVYNPSGPGYDASCANGAGVDGNIAADPGFNNLASNDYHLQSGSLAVDTGNNQVLSLLLPYGVNLPTDLDGKPRVQDASGRGCIIDMGVYEYPGNVSECGTQVTLTSSLNPSMFGQSVTFTAALSSSSGTPTGSVQFLDGTTGLATEPVSGSGTSTYTTSTLSAGSHTITANFQPNGTFAAGSASLTQVVTGDATTTTLSCQPSSFSVGLTALLAASVTSQNGTPTGSITFTDNGTVFSTQNLLNGTTNVTYTGSVAGTHTINAEYTRTGAFFPSSASCSENVEALPTRSVLAVTPQTAAAGSPVTLTASVSPANLPATPTPTGTVTFLSSGAPIGTATISAGTASLILTNLAVGTDQITCQYSGDSTYAVSACNIVPVTITATPTTLSLAASPNPAQAFQPITLTAHISSGNTTPPGQIGFFANGAAIGASPINASGVATLTINFPAGTDTLTASYVSPSTSTAAGAQSNPITEIVNPDTTTTNLSVSPNPANQHTAVTLTAQVTAASSLTVPTGTMTFLDGTNSLATVPVSATGGATYTSSSFAVGSHSLTAVYSGSPNDLASTSTPQTLTINAQDFSIDVPPPVTLRTGYHTTVKLTLTSTGNFADTVNLSCLELPQWATCNFDNANLALGANHTIPASIYFDTDAVLGYKSESRSPLALRTGFALAMLLPLGLLASPRRRKLLRRSTLLVALLVTATLLSATGCSSLYPASTPPGTYSITLTGQGQTSGISHQATFTLIVTE